MKMLYQWMNKRLLRHKTLQYKLNVIFCFFFLVPVAGLIYFGIRYNILTDRFLPLFFLGLLFFSYFGLNMLRKVFDDITGFSSRISVKVQTEFPEDQRPLHPYSGEVEQLVRSFDVIDARLQRTSAQLFRKNKEISVLRDMADLCYVTFDADEILYVALERALQLTEADLGSIMLIENTDRRRFVVRATIGLDPKVKVHDRIDFETSIAKYAVLNKTALVVADVETDTRFGRRNRPQYGTKSFICMPIKTSREIIGVLTVSRRDKADAFVAEQVDILEPLLSNAAFTYENLHLLGKSAGQQRHLAAMAAVLELVNSSLRGDELIQACFNEIRKTVPFGRALVLCRYDHRPGEVAIEYSDAGSPVAQRYFPLDLAGTIDKAFRQESAVVVADVTRLADEADTVLLGGRESTAAVLVPMKIDGRIQRVLAVAGADAGVLAPARALLTWCGRSLALALERQRLQTAVAKRNRELESIKQIGSALASSTFDLRQVLNYTMEMIRMVMNVEAGALYMVKEDQLEFAVSFNLAAESDDGEQLHLGQGIPGYVAARGETVMVNDTDGSQQFLPGVAQGCADSVRSALCVPMISQGKVIGVIEVLNKKSGDFVANDEALLQSIAASVSIAIENAHLYKSTVTMAENERGLRRMFQKFVPKQVLDQILHGSAEGAEMVEELKTLTLINIDIRGFSSLSQSLGPQRTVALLNSFFALMGGIVFKHHGIVDKYLGDGLLALFGAPVSSVADADNAVAAALEMQASLAQINAGIAAEMDVELAIGISVHTGEVVVGNIGFEMKMDYTVIGDSVNAVFRLQDRTHGFPNGILISEKTLKACRRPLNYAAVDDELAGMKIYALRGLAG